MSSGRSSVRYVGLDAEQGFPHERGAARTPVRSVADGVPRAGVDPPEGDPFRQCEGADDLGRPADQRQDLRLLAVRCRHLIHRSARRTRDELLRAMSEHRQAAWLEQVAERTGRRLRDSDLDRSRGTETLALRHRRGDDEPQPREGEPLLSGQQRDWSQHIRGPRILTCEAARQLVERRLDEIRRGEGEAPTPADCDDLAVRRNLCSRQHGVPDREAEDEPTGIVGDAAEDVEASRRPGDDHRLVRREQRVTARLDAKRVCVGKAVAGGVERQHRTRCRDDHFGRVSHARKRPVTCTGDVPTSAFASARSARLRPMRHPFGTTPDGKAVERVTLRSSAGIEVSVISYGAASPGAVGT